MKWQAPAAGFLLFIALCASIAYWGMQLFKPPVRPVAATQAAAPEIKLDAAIALLGGRAGGAAVASNFQLKGVVVAGTADESVAIIEAEGKPAKAVGVNGEITSGVVVREVHPQYVMLSEGGVTKRIELPVNATGGPQQRIDVPIKPALPTIVPPLNNNQPTPEQGQPPPSPEQQPAASPHSLSMNPGAGMPGGVSGRGSMMRR